MKCLQWGRVSESTKGATSGFNLNGFQSFLLEGASFNVGSVRLSKLVIEEYVAHRTQDKDVGLV